MMRRLFFILFVLVLAANANAGFTYDLSEIEYSYGSGENTATVIVDFDLDNYFVFEYSWDTVAGQDLTGFDVLDTFDTAVECALGVDAVWSDFFGSHYINDFDYPGGVEYPYPAESYPSWSYWGSDDNENWLMNAGVDSRVLGDGDIDSWVWTNWDTVTWDALRAPGQAPVPEPATIALLASGMVIMRRRKR